MTMKAYTIVLAWGDQEEGLYHWAGQATQARFAISKARAAMDASHNENYCRAIGGMPADPANRRGREARKRTTAYGVVEVIEGVNEYAAKDMLDVLREVRGYVATSPAIQVPEVAAILARVDWAIARGEGVINPNAEVS